MPGTPAEVQGLVIAAPQSGSGKSALTTGLLGALAASGRRVAAAKCGPDYIDPMFHAAITGRPSINLDPWAMTPDILRGLAAAQARDADLLLVEGVMGLFDGAAGGGGSTADLAAMLGLPVVLVIDVGRQAQSVAALVAGFDGFRADIRLAGLILNRVGSARHAAMLREALASSGIPVLGTVPRDAVMELPSRHLGLVPAGEVDGLVPKLDAIAALVGRHVDLAALEKVAAPLADSPPPGPLLPPPGQRIAVARDAAFCFAYPHLLQGWRDAGAEVEFFAPLDDQPPPAGADFVFLPGGYPELHAGPLAAAGRFRTGIDAALHGGARVHGECGGYMVLGQGLVDAEGRRHAMLGLLALETSFAERRLHLGYRRLVPRAGAPWSGPLLAHEFHHSTILTEGPGEPLFDATAADGTALPAMGLVAGAVSGSFAHVIGGAG